MPIRICQYGDLTPHRRGRRSSLENLPELKDLESKLASGLKPYEAVEVELPPSPVKNLREALKYRIINKLKKLKMEDAYEVHSYRANGKDFVSVANTAPVYPMQAAA